MSVVNPILGRDGAADELAPFGALLDLIYEGATCPEAWQDVPRAVCRWIDAPYALMFTPLHTRENGGFLHTHGMSAHALELWNTRYHAHDVWVKRVLAEGAFYSGNVGRDQDFECEAEFLASEMYREWFAPQDIGRMLTTALFGLEQSAMPPCVCTLNRPLRRPFSEEDVERYRLLSPHLSRAMGVMYKLRGADYRLATTLSALDRLDKAVMLLDRQGRVAHANVLAQRILARGDGLKLAPLRSGEGASELRVADPVHQRRLDAAMQGVLSVRSSAIGHFSKAIEVPRALNAEPYRIQLSPLPSHSPFGVGARQSVAIAFIDEGRDRPICDDAVMVRRYGLSPAEIRVVAEALDGTAVNDIAQRLCLSPNTVKTHLRQIYAKTGAGSRSALLKVAMASRLGEGLPSQR